MRPENAHSTSSIALSTNRKSNFEIETLQMFPILLYLVVAPSHHCQVSLILGFTEIKTTNFGIPDIPLLSTHSLDPLDINS